MGRLLWLALAFVFVPLSNSQVFGDDLQSASKEVPQDLYELQFLGAKLKKEANSHSHTGLFLLIWKGQKAIKIFGYRDDKKNFSPFPSFNVHYSSGWKTVGPWCGTGNEWVAFQPGEVIVFSLGMGWVEDQIPGGNDPKDADKTRLSLRRPMESYCPTNFHYHCLLLPRNRGF